MKIRATFRGITVEEEVGESDEYFSISFDGHYLIGVYNNNGVLEPTGQGMNGYGEPLRFIPQEFTYEEIKE